MKYDDDMTIISRYLLIAMFLLIGVFIFADTIDAVEQPARYRIIGLQPFAFEWTDSLPYSELGAMCWNNKDGFCDIDEAPTFLYSIVDIDTGFIIEVFKVHDKFYALTFAESRGEDGQPHPISAVWISEL